SNCRAEGVGFEPTNALRRLRFSRPVQSTALPSLRRSAAHNTSDSAPRTEPLNRLSKAAAGSRFISRFARPMLGRCSELEGHSMGTKLLILVGLLATADFGVTAENSRRPNIVLLLTDDQRADCLGCAGHPILKTPNIDALAADGMRFRNAFVTTSICCVSRA